MIKALALNGNRLIPDNRFPEPTYSELPKEVFRNPD